MIRLVWDGTRLKQLREGRGWSYVEMAFRCGAKSTQHVRFWESGTQPNGAYLLSIAKCLDVDPAYFYAEVETAD